MNKLVDECVKRVVTSQTTSIEVLIIQDFDIGAGATTIQNKVRN